MLFSTCTLYVHIRLVITYDVVYLPVCSQYATYICLYTEVTRTPGVLTACEAEECQNNPTKLDTYVYCRADIIIHPQIIMYRHESKPQVSSSVDPMIALHCMNEVCSGLPSKRINLSPFTKDFRGGGHLMSLT